MKLSEGSPEAMDVTELVEFAAKQDMAETAEMTELRAEIVAALQDPTQEAHARELYARYEGHLDGLLQTATTLRGQIGEQILKAAIFGAAGRDDMFVDFLRDARTDARQSGFMWEEANIISGLARKRGFEI